MALPLLLLGGLAVGGSILSAIIGSRSAGQAADAQSEAAEDAIALQAATLQQARIDSYPWAVAGTQALYKLNDELGIPRPVNPILPNINAGPLGQTLPGGTTGGSGTPQTPPDYWSGGIPNAEDIQMTPNLDFQETPGYAFQVSEGEKAITQNLNKLGLRGSGAALEALTSFRQGVANQEYGNYLNRLAGVAGVGQAQTAQTNALGAQVGANIGNTMQDAGAARASGYVGRANSWIDAIGGMSNQLGFLYGLDSGAFN